MNTTCNRLLAVVGTRPEVVKMAPVIRCLEEEPEHFSVELAAVEQHGEVLHAALAEWGLRPARVLPLPRSENTTSLTASLSTMLPALYELIHGVRPDWVLVQGDTLTAFAAALAAAYAGRPVAHIEAGLRSFDRSQPFPEELHRELVGRLAQVHYVPSERARDNLLAEGCPADSIRLVGNTVVDAMRIMLGGEVTSFPLRDCAPFRILVTAHRRENFASGVKNLCMALDQLARERERLEITYVLHPNPEARRPVLEILRNVPQVHLIEAIGYRDFLTVLSNSDLVLTDSGGIQEEAPYFGRPVLVIRSRTERHEAAELGNAELSGTDTAAIVRAVSRLLDDPELYRQRAVRVEPFGDGHAAERIRADLKERSACLQ